MNYADMTIAEIEAAIGIEYKPSTDYMLIAETTPEQCAIFDEWLTFHPEYGV